MPSTRRQHSTREKTTRRDATRHERAINKSRARNACCSELSRIPCRECSRRCTALHCTEKERAERCNARACSLRLGATRTRSDRFASHISLSEERRGEERRGSRALACGQQAASANRSVRPAASRRIARVASACVARPPALASCARNHLCRANRNAIPRHPIPFHPIPSLRSRRVRITLNLSLELTSCLL